jgi:hypothetical protein
MKEIIMYRHKFSILGVNTKLLQFVLPLTMYECRAGFAVTIERLGITMINKTEISFQ